MDLRDLYYFETIADLGNLGGSHSTELLKQLGYSDEQMQALQAAGVVTG